MEVNRDNEKEKREADVHAQNGKPAMTRLQKRATERANEEAKAVFEGLVKQYWDCFFDNTPTDQIVIEKEQEVIAKWKMYHKRRKLLPVALEMVSEACKNIREDYEKTRGQ